MKLYIIIRWDYDCRPYSVYTVEYIYEDKDTADKKVEELNKDNDKPVVSDLYGPLSGSRFDLWERDMDK